MIPLLAGLAAIVVIDSIAEDEPKKTSQPQEEVKERKGLSKKDIPEEARCKIRKLNK